MRVLHVAEAFGGGLMQMVLDVSAGTARAGHDVAIAYGVRPETPEDLPDRTPDGVELRRLGWTSRRPGAQVRGALELGAFVRRWRPDVVHLHSSFSGVIGAAVVPRGVTTIFSPHAFASAVPEGSARRRAAYRRLEQLACRRADLVGAVSPSEIDAARERGARRVVCVPNGIAELDPERAVTRPHDDGGATGRPLIVAAGRTVPQRRPEACARILASIADTAEVAWLGGGGGERGVAGARALEAAGVPPSGWLPREALLARLGVATAYLHWTVWDGLPLSVLEALALDVLVVASDIPPNRDVLGGDGVCATESEAVAELRRLATDPAAARDLRERQRARRTAFSAQRMVAGWLEVYAAAIERSTSPASYA